MILSITGHRPDKLPDKQTGYRINPCNTFVRNELRKHILEIKPEKLLSGVALGIDTIAAEICIELGVKWDAIVPFKGQENYWPLEARERYHKLITAADQVVIVNPGGFASWKMQTRNQYLVDHSSKLLAVFIPTERKGGTFNCIQYANKQKKEIIYINPMDYKQKT